VELFLADLEAHEENCEIQWTVDQMAGSCGLRTTQFTEYVRRLTNMTPLHYLNDRRFRHAARLLRRSKEITVTDVALACGFSSGQYFATVFRDKFGCSPTAYRAGVAERAVRR
jgi:AraC family L-rhamnose operon regulatory protein RhaS